MVQRKVFLPILVLMLVVQTMSAQQKPVSALKVTKAVLGTGVENRKITGETVQFDLNQKVYLWLEVTGGPADSMVVTWKTSDHEFTTKLRVGGPTYHTWAYKTAAFAGPWTVSVADASGLELKSLQFSVGEAPKK